MKKVLEIKKLESGIVKVRLEATKRITLYFRVKLDNTRLSCKPEICPIYDKALRRVSPLPKYVNFCYFCNNLFREYPELKEWFQKEEGVTSLNQVLPVEKKIN